MAGRGEGDAVTYGANIDATLRQAQQDLQAGRTLTNPAGLAEVVALAGLKPLDPTTYGEERMSDEFAKAAAMDAGTATLAADLAIREADKAKRTVADLPRRQAEQERQLAAERARRELVGEERGILARLSPRRNPWPELAEHDQRLADLDQRLAAAAADVHELEEQLKDAERDDHAALTRWHAAGDGPRPEPSAQQIRQQLEQRREDVAALNDVVAAAAADRAAFVEKHRDRLAARADSLTDETRARYLDLVAELATVRDDLLAYVGAARFARLFPDPAASTETPNPVSLQPAGQRTHVAFEQLLDTLRADAERLAHRPGSEHAPSRAAWLSAEDEAKAVLAENKARLAAGNQWG